MNPIKEKLSEQIKDCLFELYGIREQAIKLEQTNKDFEGDFTFVVFPFLKYSKKKPEDTATEIGEELQSTCAEVRSYNVVKGFLNLSLSDAFWCNSLQTAFENESYGKNTSGNGRKVLIEYSSPNTNKPLHLGHIRNNLLGYALACILEENGVEVIKANLINDRGIHICKSMLAWQKFGEGKTPESEGIKGDHLVGKYYVLFDKLYKEQIQELIDQGKTKEDAEKHAPIMAEAREMLKQWEDGEPAVRELWQKMNEWVYQGFEKSYKRLGVDFDKFYYESDTYLLGKSLVIEGLEKGVFYKKEDGSIWANLADYGLDEKLLLRSDGTSVYITQDLGTAELKYQDFEANDSVYVVGNEQDYHFKVLKILLEMLEKPYAPGIYHMSYGMVDLPSGKMKSREGTVVDADDLMEEMKETAKVRTEALGKTEGMKEEELSKLHEMLGLGALKYFILKVDPQKRMLFNPEESIDFQGDTGPFIQYTHARISSVLRNAQVNGSLVPHLSLNDYERELIRIIYRYPERVKEAGDQFSPSVIAQYVHDLSRAYNRFYHECPILREADQEKRDLRICLSTVSARIIKNACRLIGIEVPDRM